MSTLRAIGGKYRALMEASNSSSAAASMIAPTSFRYLGNRIFLRNFLFSEMRLYHPFLTNNQQLQQSNAKLRFSGIQYSFNREFSVFNEFSKKIQGEANSNKEFQQSVKQLKEKAEELKGVTEDLKVRVKQTTKQLHKQVDGVWTEAEETAKKVKETLGLGGQEPSVSNGTSSKNGSNAKEGTTSSGEQYQKPEPSGSGETFFGKIRSTFTSSSPKVSYAFQRLKEAKVTDFAKKGYAIVKEELNGQPNRRKQMQYTSTSTGEKSDRTEVVVVPVKQSPWSKKWESVKEKVRSHPMFKRVNKLSEPVVTKSQELAEDLQERWETSDSPVVHKIQDLNDKVFGENDAAMSFKEIRRRDPSFSLPDFVSETQEVIKPVLNAYLKGDFKVLAKYCSPEVVERCKAEHKAYESQDIFFDNKILHVSEVDVRETKMMGSSPIIILAFQTQQVYCVRDRHGLIKDGSKDTIHTVYYAWAMQQMEPEEMSEDAIYSMWRLREMQQLGVAALI